MKIDKKVSTEIRKFLCDDSAKQKRDADPVTSEVDELLSELEHLSRVVDYMRAFERRGTFPVTSNN